MSRLLEQVLHNEESGVILITVSDQVSSDTLKKIYNLILDEEIRSTKDLHLAKDKDKFSLLCFSKGCFFKWYTPGYTGCSGK